MLPAKLCWDGSALGTLDGDSVLESIRSHQNIVYWKFKYDGETEHCISRQVSGTIKSSHQSIIDEVKAIFGIPKMGTHRARWLGKTYILLKVPKYLATKDVIQEEYAMGKIPGLNDCLTDHPEIKIRMQHLLAFWDVMGVKGTENCALLRNFGTTSQAIWSPVGFRELRIDPNDFGHFSQVILNKWFDDISVPQAVVRMLGITTPDQLYHKQTWIRSTLQDVFRRLDNKELHLVAKIIQRIINRVSQVVG